MRFVKLSFLLVAFSILVIGIAFAEDKGTVQQMQPMEQNFQNSSNIQAKTFELKSSVKAISKDETQKKSNTVNQAETEIDHLLHSEKAAK